MSPLPEVKVQNPPAQPVTPEGLPQRITILSELDSYIAERMKEQPQSLEEAVSRIEVQSNRPHHRMQLPEYFRQHSADVPGAKEGRYAFRWVLKQKRSLDDHLAKGWLFVNRTYFPQAPRYLFTANGGVEIGDTLLAFIPIKKALQMREAPGKLSQERLKGQMTQTKQDYVLMTGNQRAPHVYQPELGPETSEASEEKVPGVLTEGRDF